MSWLDFCNLMFRLNLFVVFCRVREESKLRFLTSPIYRTSRFLFCMFCTVRDNLCIGLHPWWSSGSRFLGRMSCMLFLWYRESWIQHNLSAIWCWWCPKHQLKRWNCWKQFSICFPSHFLSLFYNFREKLFSPSRSHSPIASLCPCPYHHIYRIFQRWIYLLWLRTWENPQDSIDLWPG